MVKISFGLLLLMQYLQFSFMKEKDYNNVVTNLEEEGSGLLSWELLLLLDVLYFNVIKVHTFIVIYWSNGMTRLSFVRFSFATQTQSLLDSFPISKYHSRIRHPKSCGRSEIQILHVFVSFCIPGYIVNIVSSFLWVAEIICYVFLFPCIKEKALWVYLEIENYYYQQYYK